MRCGDDDGEELMSLARLGLRHATNEVLRLAKDIERISVNSILLESARPVRLQTEEPATERLPSFHARAWGNVAPERLRRPDERSETATGCGRRSNRLQLHALEHLGEEHVRQQREATGLRAFLEALLVLATLLLLTLLS